MLRVSTETPTSKNMQSFHTVAPLKAFYLIVAFPFPHFSKRSDNYAMAGQKQGNKVYNKETLIQICY